MTKDEIKKLLTDKNYKTPKICVKCKKEIQIYPMIQQFWEENGKAQHILDLDCKKKRENGH